MGLLRACMTPVLALAPERSASASQMFFTIDWPHNHIFGAEHLKLAFEDVAEAELWHRELERAIGAAQCYQTLNPYRAFMMGIQMELTAASPATVCGHGSNVRHKRHCTTSYQICGT
jgi:hypothetical protein